MRNAAQSISSLAAVVVTMTAISCVAPTEAIPRAAAHWAQCSPCHGDNGGGNIVQLAPAIAGLPAWYVDAQLMKYRMGARGAHFDDVGGMRMKPMAMALISNDDVRNMAEYVAQLPLAPGPSTFSADAVAGKNAFAVCTACHGADGAGNELMNAPPIAGRDDWYLLESLKKFKSGIRGNNAKDKTGGAMRAIAMTLPDEQAMRNVVHYAATMPPVTTVRAAAVNKVVPTEIEAAIKAVAAESQQH